MPDRKAFAARAGAALLLALSALHFVAAFQRAGARGVVDLPIFLERARQFRETGVLYPDAADARTWEPGAAVYKFPPTFALLLLPLAVPGGEARAIAIHRVAQAGLYLAAVALLLRALAPRSRARTFVVLGLGLALNFEPFFETLWRLQLETPILALLALGLVPLVRGQDAPLGAAIGAAAMLKVYPAFLAAYLVVRARWRALGVLVGTAALIGVASLVVIGAAENRAFWLDVLPALLRELPVAMSENMSPARYLLALGGLDPAVAKRIGQLLAFAALGGAAYVVRRALSGSAPAARDGVALALFVVTMLLAMPNGWANYQLLLLPALLALLAYVLDEGREAAWSGAALACAYVPLLFYHPCAPPDVGWPCAETPPFLGLIELPRALHDALVAARGASAPILWAALVALLAREARNRLR
jgi:glycosyl transferase family 87